MKWAIINSFMALQLRLENGRNIEDYEYIKEAICLENYITICGIDPSSVDQYIKKATLNLKMNDL